MFLNSKATLTKAEVSHHNPRVLTTGARIIATGASVIKAGARVGFNIAEGILSQAKVTFGKVKVVKEKA